jgi:hypothetical protein
LAQQVLKIHQQPTQRQGGTPLLKVHQDIIVAVGPCIATRARAKNSHPSRTTYRCKLLDLLAMFFDKY